MKRNQTSAQTPAALLNDLRGLVAETEKMIGGNISEQTANVVGAMRTRLETAQGRLHELYGGVQQKVAASAKSADKAVRANPYQSLAIAAGAGLLLGVLLSRRCANTRNGR